MGTFGTYVIVITYLSVFGTIMYRLGFHSGLDTIIKILEEAEKIKEDNTKT
jgi:hypothetical protein